MQVYATMSAQLTGIHWAELQAQLRELQQTLRGTYVVLQTSMAAQCHKKGGQVVAAVSRGDGSAEKQKQRGSQSSALYPYIKSEDLLLNHQLHTGR